MSKRALKNGINAFLDNGESREILRKVIRIYGDDNWAEINAALAEWEKAGYLKILIPPEPAADEQPCIKMLKYIEKPSPWGDKWP